MTEFRIHDETTAPESARPILETAKANYGFLPNLLGELAESPAALEAYTTLNAIMAKTDLSPAEQQIVLLTVSFENRCEYCVSAHTAIAGQTDLGDDAIEAIRAGKPLADSRQEALAAFTRQVVRERGWVEDADVKAFLDAGFTKANVLDVIVGVGMKTLSNYANHIAETPLDDAFAPVAWRADEAA
ncbi:carboxymuconolactone decarboxylase [Marinicauda salina]|uniref:Carboxymuconolactone decarboxylase n=1 Tax=Marinicauda salina TaxID=2135793 RepID=A0A2U2BXP7_9PROT|nr:carboxymuconolactone decarboxylase family protein [Marinicauda salina]PWE18782.1 carboxymuconolactone decarboxylase [Marinicauda salina]